MYPKGNTNEGSSKRTMSAFARTPETRKREGDDSSCLRPSEIFFSLWEVIVKWDDICFKHILPRLNQTDVKFLYEVNTETRKLIKRSTRARDLKKRFKVREMSSISTLDFAWEHKSLWPRWWTERDFCNRVADTNKLELLKWAREEKNCDWDEWTICAAARQGNLEMVSIALQMSVLLMRMRVQELPETVISSASNTYAKKSKRLGLLGLPIGWLKRVISTYSNILLSVNMMNITIWRVSVRPRTATSTV